MLWNCRSCQGIDFRKPLQTSPALQQAHSALRQQVPFAAADRLLAQDIEVAAGTVRMPAVQSLAQALELNLTAIVIAHRSDVFHREPELGARNHGAGHLAAGAQNFLFECDLPGIRGKMREHDEGVGGVEAHADYVELRHEVTGYRRQKAGGRRHYAGSRATYAAIGTDTAGSIREPAALCGCVGVKPTYGRVSSRGVIPLSASLDHVGPLAASVEDAAITLQAIAGYDPGDITSADIPVADYASAMREG